MRRFRFRLQKLLEVRQLREDLQEQELARARQALNRGKSALRRLETARTKAVEELRAGFHGALDVGVIGVRHRYLAFLSRGVRDQQAVVERLAREEAARRGALIRARRERQVVEKLKERAYARYQEEAARAEQAFLDEVGTVRYTREGGDELSGSIVFRTVRRR